MTDSDALNAGAHAWAELRGLKMMTEWAGAATLSPIAGSREMSSEASAHMDDLLDHSRHFRLSRRQSPAISVSAPYLRSVVSKFGSVGKTIVAIHDLAASLDLQTRIGIEADTIYEVGAPVLPIVWWNPSRAELEVIEVEAFIGRLNAGPSQR